MIFSQASGQIVFDSAYKLILNFSVPGDYAIFCRLKNCIGSELSFVLFDVQDQNIIIYFNTDDIVKLARICHIDLKGRF